jgi:hypothetical protein
LFKNLKLLLNFDINKNNILNFMSQDTFKLNDIINRLIASPKSTLSIYKHNKEYIDNMFVGASCYSEKIVVNKRKIRSNTFM